MKKIISIVSLVFIAFTISSQNIAITDDNSYTADPSAMLDVKSLTKGMLVPRMTSVQRTSISSPATGLLVFDTNENAFYFYTGAVWSNLSVGQLWTKSGSYVYLSNTDDNVGIGVTDPNNKLLVKADASTGIDESIFAVLNNNGDTVFAVYQEGVRIWVDDNGGTKSNGSRGGFAVGGYSPTKAGFTNEYLRVTPDSVRIYIDDDYVLAKANGSRGGFAVGGFSPSKGATTDNYLFVQDDSTRIYTGDSTSGFGVENLGSGTSVSYMHLTPLNYFIGHQAGDSITTGKYNSFFGYQCGISNRGGNNNVFTGYRSGYTNVGGSFNTFMGYRSGMMNESSDNTFIGYEAGLQHQGGGGNVFIGSKSGQNDVNGQQNVFIGENAGFDNFNGQQNIFMGFNSGASNSNGSFNVFIGTENGYSNTTGGYNTLIGYKAGRLSNAYYNLMIGYFSGMNTTNGSSNVFLGSYAGYSNTTGGINVFIGTSSGYKNTSGTNNIFIGEQSGYSNLTASGNIFVGRDAGYYNKTGWGNLFIGNMSGQFDTIGSTNVYLGVYSGQYCQGNNNVCVGPSTNQNNNLGNNNTSLGNSAGQFSTGSYNLFLGYYAGHNNTGSNNIFLGYNSGFNDNGSDRLYIENSSNTVNPLINGDFQNDRLAINRQADLYPFQVGTTTFNGNGAFLTGGGVWTAGSSRDFKDRFVELDVKDVLTKIENLELKGWYYKNTQEYHIGPFAEDFYNAFGTGVLDVEKDLGKYLSATDVAGVSMVAIKELIQENKELRKEIEEIKAILNQSAKN